MPTISKPRPPCNRPHSCKRSDGQGDKTVSYVSWSATWSIQWMSKHFIRYEKSFFWLRRQSSRSVDIRRSSANAVSCWRSSPLPRMVRDNQHSLTRGSISVDFNLEKFQGLIQMKDATTAQSAKVVRISDAYLGHWWAVLSPHRQTLNGQNIYNGCCTLQIDFSKLQALNVKFNNDKSRDYTNPTLPASENSNEPIAIGARYVPGRQMSIFTLKTVRKSLFEQVFPMSMDHQLWPWLERRWPLYQRWAMLEFIFLVSRHWSAVYAVGSNTKLHRILSI